TSVGIAHHPAYLDVRSDKSDTNWLLLEYESDRSDRLVVTKTGTHGLSELRDALDDSKASYGYARVTYSNDKESQREKFILVGMDRIWLQGDAQSKDFRTYSECQTGAACLLNRGGRS
ncbi:putative actin depolymerizing protein, partial [Butyriboletus roseoflavus]